MHAKLTLRLDEDLIARAKTWAAARGISVSEAVGQFFAQLDVKKEGYEPSPWMKSITGIARRPGKRAPTDEELDEARWQHVKKKHG